ncbi:MAG TPA: ABC transporter permease [Microbacterium sp.]|nr:ABC transporter permease [Microbacterium sp.]
MSFSSVKEPAPMSLAAAGPDALDHRRAVRWSEVRLIATVIAKRLLAGVVVLFIVTVLIFLFIHAAPGGPEVAIAGLDATPEQLAAIRELYRLDDPLPVQYWTYISSALTGDLGTSFMLREPVADAIGRALSGVTIPLIIITWTTALVFGVSLGYISARKRGQLLDRTIVGITVVGATAPMFATGLLISTVFGVQLRWFPFFGSGSGGLDTLYHLVLPALTMVIVMLASTTRISRVRFAQVLEEDQYAFAKARGVSPRAIFGRIIFRNSAVQLITWAGSVIVGLMTGLIIVEQIYSLPGIGSLLITAIGSRDIPMIQGITLVIAVAIVLVTIIVDVLCIIVDPRIRRGMEADA